MIDPPSYSEVHDGGCARPVHARTRGRDARHRSPAQRKLCTALFLDLRMPGLTGLEVARRAAEGAHIVFVTAYDQYAIKVFEHEAVDTGIGRKPGPVDRRR
jgi:DNA-binding LytR/AlgR family response regulator